ncbi:hypothetical protein G6F44_001574 [Rhizopus delemar]|nr:hypothetical protein G6F44_001574 [Rhizopus delemar]
MSYIASLEEDLKRIEGLLTKIANDKQERFDSDSNSSQEDASEHRSNIWKQEDEEKTEKEKPDNPYTGYSIYHTFEGQKYFQKLFNRFFQPTGIQMQTRQGSQILRVRKAEMTDLDTKIDSLKDAVVAGLIDPDEPINGIEDWIWKIAGIDKDLSDRLLKVYFANVHPLIPVINKTAFLQEYRRIRPQFPFGPLLLSMYLAALAYIETYQKVGDAESLNNNEPWNIPEDLAGQLNSRFLKYNFQRYIPTLSMIQSAIIAQIRPYNFDRWTTGWLLSFSAVRISQDLSCHKSNEKLDISQEEKETRYRLWWYVYMQDCWYSAETGRPLTIFDGDFDEIYPSEDASLDEVMDTMTETDQHLPRFPSMSEELAKHCKTKTVPVYRVLNEMIKLSRILAMILQNLYTPQGKKYCAEHGSDAIVGYLDSELSKWRDSLPSILDISFVEKMSQHIVKREHLLAAPEFISISYYTSLILLHRPFIRQDTDDTKTKLSSQTSLAICTSAAARIIGITDGMRYRDFLWGFSIYSTITATLIHVFNARSSDKTTSQAAKSKLVRALAVIDKLNILWPGKDGLENLLRKKILKSRLCAEDPEFAELLKSQQMIENSLQSTIPEITNKDNHENVSTTNKPDQTLKTRRLPEKKEEEHESTTFTKDYNWLDQLYLPSQQAPNENNYLIPNSVIGNNDMQQHLIDVNDLYSIRQFGFNTTSHNPMFSQAQPLPSFSNANMQIPFDATSNVQNVSAFNQHTEFPLFNSNMPFPYAPSFGDQSIVFNSDTEAATNYLNQGTIPSRNISTDPLLFQNSEGITTNSFWGVPNDMNVEDWITAKWSEDKGWDSPEIRPYENLSLAPSAVVFHYGIECFEGMKAYKDKNGKIRLFRPDMNMARMNRSTERIALPQFNGDELIKVISEYLKIDERWIPNERGYSLYLRPTMIGTQEALGVHPSTDALLFVIGSPVGPYYKTGFNAVRLYATSEYVRAWPRGTGSAKIGGNYAPGLMPQRLASAKGYQQNLWLFGPDHQLTEVGAMNLFMMIKDEHGQPELVTPPLDGSILPGVTRDSIIQLAKDWNEFKVSERNITMPELRELVKEGRVLEMFGAGTACVVSPVKEIGYMGEDLKIPLDPNDPNSQAGPYTKRFNDAIYAIQYGEVEHPWSVVIN